MISTFTKTLFVILSSSKVTAADYCQHTCSVVTGCESSVCKPSVTGGRSECTNLAKIGASNSASDFSLVDYFGSLGGFAVHPQYCDEIAHIYHHSQTDYIAYKPSLNNGKQKVELFIGCPSVAVSDVPACASLLGEAVTKEMVGTVTVAIPENNYAELSRKFERPDMTRPSPPVRPSPPPIPSPPVRPSPPPRPFLPQQPVFPFLPSGGIRDLYPGSPYFPFNDPFLTDDTLDSFPFLPNPFRSMRLLNKQRLMTVTRAGPKGRVVQRTFRGFDPRGFIHETARFPLAGPRVVGIDYSVDSSGNIVKNIVETKHNGWFENKVIKTHKLKGNLNEKRVSFDSFGNEHTKQYSLDRNNNIVKVKTIKDLHGNVITTRKALGPKKKVRFHF